MKKMFLLAVVLSVASVPVKADPSVGVVAAVAVVSALIGRFSPQLTELKPAPELTDACKAKSVKAKDGNYEYITYEGCLN